MGLLWTAVLNSYLSAELLSYSTFEQIKDIMPIFIVSLVYFSGTMLHDNNLVKLIAQVFIRYPW